MKNNIIKGIVIIAILFSFLHVTGQNQGGIDPVYDVHITTLAEKLLRSLVDTNVRLPIACTEDEILKAIYQRYNLDDEAVGETLSTLENLLNLIETKQITNSDMLKELVNCEERCGKILSVISGCYIIGMSLYFKGLVFFNLGQRNIVDGFEGDGTHALMYVDNRTTLDRIYADVYSNPNYKIILEARASLRGNETENEQLTLDRANSVQNWFESKGISSDRIKILYLGEYGPHISKQVCDLYKINSLYDKYQGATSDIDLNGNVVIDGLNQSVAIYLVPQSQVNIGH